MLIRLLKKFLRFNSIKVRLEQGWHPERQTRRNQFQFHKGTIRTQPDFAEVSKFAKFQFHKGTIRTY